MFGIKTQLVAWLSWVGVWLLSERSLVRFLAATKPHFYYFYQFHNMAKTAPLTMK